MALTILQHFLTSRCYPCGESHPRKPMVEDIASVPSEAARRVLIVDDDEGIRLVLGAIVRKAGYLVTFVSNTRDAIAEIGDAPPSMIFTDIFMPEVDGFELINWLRRQGSVIPLIAMSGSNKTLTGQLGTAEKLGAGASISKPFAEKDVLGAMKLALGESRPAWPGQRWN
jgi:two-component system OmpR family response regulator